MDPIGPAPRRVTVIMITLAVVAMIGSAVPEPGSAPARHLYLVPVVVTTALMGVAVRIIPHGQRRPWGWLLLGQGLFLVGEVWFDVLATRGSAAWPTFADAVYLVAYVPVAVGLLGLNQQRHPAPHRESLLDAAIVSLSAAVLFGIFVVVPIASRADQSMLVRVVSSVYPVVDLVMIFLLARMLTGPGVRTPAYWCLVVAVTCTVVADVSWNVVQLTQGGDVSSRWMNLLWQCYYLFNAIAAGTASAARPAERKPRSDTGLTVVRLAVLGVAATLPSAVIVGLRLPGASLRPGVLSEPGPR